MKITVTLRPIFGTTELLVMDSSNAILSDSGMTSLAGEYILKNKPKNEKTVSRDHYVTPYGEVLLVGDKKAKQLEILFLNTPVQWNISGAGTK